MAEIAEGYTFTATVTLNIYDALAVLGDIKLPKTSISEDTLDCSASLTLEDTNTDAFIGDILRANTGSQGFSIKGSCSLGVLDETQYVGDIKHGKIKITQESADANASLTLDNIDTSAYVGDILRANAGKQGFSINASSTLNSLDSTAVIGDIKHSIAIDSDKARDVKANLILDNMDSTGYLGDILRTNYGKQGFSVNAVSDLDGYDETQVLGDIYRSVGGRLWNRLGVVAYKGKFYFIHKNDKIQDILILENGDENN